MTTTRISHTGHNHPSTTAARTECRKAMKATTKAVPTVDLATIGNGVRFHYIDNATGTTRCGKVQPVFVRTAPITDVDCVSCRNKFGQAHS